MDRRDGKPQRRHRGDGPRWRVLGHPATGIIWLARRYAEQGLSLEAGQTILAGSFTRPIDIAAGDTFHFDFGDLGSFGLEFS